MAKKTFKISEILRKLMFEKHIRTTDLARALNLPQPTVHRIVTGQSTNPHKSTIEPIADYFNLTVDQLLGNEALPGERKTTLPIKGHITNLPLVSWNEIAQYAQDQTFATTEYVVGHPGMGDRCFAVKLADSSMEPQFSKGTTLIFNPDKEPTDRCYVLVLLAESKTATFRQLLIDADYRYLKPLNPDLNIFKMRLLDRDDKIMGVLIEARQNYDDVKL